MDSENEKKVIKRTVSHTHLNQLKDSTCFKFTEYLYLIAKIGNGVMLQSQVERYMFYFFNISSATVLRNLKELKFNNIIQVEKLDKINIIVLKKYAYRFIREEETGIKVQSREISTPRMTTGRINKSVWLNEFILRTQIENNKITDVLSLINYLNNSTTLIYGRNDKIVCFDSFIRDVEVNVGVRNNLKNEVSRINKNRVDLLKNLITATKQKNNLDNVIDNKINKKTKDNFDFNRMFYNNLHVTRVDNQNIVISLFDINRTLTESKIIWILENIYEYLKADIFTHITFKDGLEPVINITIQLLVDTQTTKQEVVSLIKRLKNKTKLKNSVTNPLNFIGISCTALNISKNCFKNENIIN